MQYIKGVSPTDWSEFAASLRSAGYEIDILEPSPGSIFTFTREGSFVLLATDAQNPADFVGVVLERLQKQA